MFHCIVRNFRYCASFITSITWQRTKQWS